MRLTTKIIIGIILGIFAISLALIIGFSFTEPRNYSNNRTDFDLSETEKKIVDIGNFETLVLDIEGLNNTGITNPYGELSVLPLDRASEEAPKIELPKGMADHLITQFSGDTLYLTIDVEGLEKSIRIGEFDKYHSSIEGLSLTIYSHSTDVINKAPRISTRIEGMEADEIKVSSRGSIRIKDCTAKTIRPRTTSHASLLLENSRVGTLYIDLDEIRNWTVKNCDIAVENLTGSSEHSVLQPKSEAREVNWIPKTKDAKLHVTLRADTARIVFSEL